MNCRQYWVTAIYRLAKMPRSRLGMETNQRTASFVPARVRSTLLTWEWSYRLSAVREKHVVSGTTIRCGDSIGLSNVRSLVRRLWWRTTGYRGFLTSQSPFYRVYICEIIQVGWSQYFKIFTRNGLSVPFQNSVVAWPHARLLSRATIYIAVR